MGSAPTNPGLDDYRARRHGRPTSGLRSASGPGSVATRIGGVALNKQPMRDALSGVLALAPAPHRFTVGEFAAKIHARTGTSDAECTIRQAAYDLRKLCGKELVDKPARTRRYRVPALAAGTIAALLKVIAPILAGIRSPRIGRKPKGWSSIDRDYEQIRVNMQTLFDDRAPRPAGCRLRTQTPSGPHRQRIGDRESSSG